MTEDDDCDRWEELLTGVFGLSYKLAAKDDNAFFFNGQ